MNLLIVILESIILASALSIDAFATSFAYANNKIKIPFLSVLLINIVCSSILGLSLLIGTIVKLYIPNWLTILICFIILSGLGIIKLLDGITKSVIRKYNNLDKKIKFSFFNLKFILILYANPEKADVDNSRVISSMEAITLAIALSLDGLGAGFGVALENSNGLMIFFVSLITNTLAILLGCYVGSITTKKYSYNFSWVAGAILIILAILKLL